MRIISLEKTDCKLFLTTPFHQAKFSIMSGGIHPQLQSRSVDNWESGCLMPETTEVDKIDQACEQIETLS